MWAGLFHTRCDLLSFESRTGWGWSHGVKWEKINEGSQKPRGWHPEQSLYPSVTTVSYPPLLPENLKCDTGHVWALFPAEVKGPSLVSLTRVMTM